MHAYKLFSGSINPETIYYLFIYAFIIFVRFTKIYGQNKPWQEYFFISLEFVYSSVGIVIVLMTQAEQNSLSAVFIIYCFILMVSVFLDANDKFSLNMRVAGHLFIIGTVITSAIYFNQTLLFPKEIKTETRVAQYLVSVPYYDLAARAYVGDKFGTRKFVYISKTMASNPADAVRNAQADFHAHANEIALQVDPRRKRNADDLVIDTNDILAMPANNAPSM